MSPRLAQVDVRLKVLGYCKGLLENCTDATQRTNLISVSGPGPVLC